LEKIDYNRNRMDGILLVDKPRGPSSHDVVDRVRQVFKIKKAGHTGTLDPLATGLLLICLGRATKLAPFLQDLSKIYEGKMIFGVTTSTLDSEGEIVEEKDASSLSREKIEEIFAHFQGEIVQTPPMFSAIHQDGKRLYELARSGQEVKRSPRIVNIHQLQALRFSFNSHPQVEFRTHCSKGTYIRSLCADIGEASGFGAYQLSLRRTRIGPFDLKQASKLEDLDGKSKEEREENILSLKDALPHLPLVTIKRGAEKIVRWGRPLYLYHIHELPSKLEKGDRVRLCTQEGKLLAVGISLQEGTHFCEDRVGFKYLRVLI
jgi:tRNA pseudouridine55 synthase